MQSILFSKKLIFICFISITFLSMTSCNQEKIKDIDVKELGKSLLSNITYEDELTEIDQDIANTIYDFTDIHILNSVFYIGSGATAEEIVVLKCENAEQATKAKEKLETRITEQKESFQNYVPEELKKLDKSVLIIKGSYTILSISNTDTKAKEIIEDAFK